MDKHIVNKSTSGMEISEMFYKNYIKAAFQEEIPELYEQMAIGLVGEGSECYGYDDEISTDHDFGIRLRVWVPEEIIDHSNLIKEIMEKMAVKYAMDLGMKYDLGKREVFEIESFYAHFTGLFHKPNTNSDWLSIPIENLSVVTSGKVFEDQFGKFTEIREYLEKCYPEDARLKKISYHLVMAAQAGQYNYPRILGRKDYVTARLLQARFIENILAAVCMLDRIYPPYFKWIYKTSSENSGLGKVITKRIEELVLLDQEAYGSKCMILIEEICWLISDYMRANGISEQEDNYLLNQAKEVISHIRDQKLRNMNIWIDKE